MPDSIDELTGLLSIKSFLEQLEPATKTGDALVLVVMDLDHLLAFNEKYGHIGGDAWIKTTSQMFKETFAGAGSLIGRYGGDEFMAVIRESDPSKVFQQAEGLRARVEKDKPAILFNGEEIRPGYTISLGLAAFPANAVNVDDLVDKGKLALRRAKMAGGNQVCFYQDTDFLTGLLTASATQHALEEAVTRARAASDSVSVFALDVDRFKEINDEYGHRAGDEVLKRVGHILQSNFAGVPAASVPAADAPGAEPPADMAGAGICGRLGGDEFIVILPGQRADFGLHPGG